MYLGIWYYKWLYLIHLVNFFITISRILFAQWYIFSIFNQTYLIEEIKYLLELEKKVIHLTKLSLAIELHFLVNANKYLFRSPKTQDLVESSRFSLTLTNLHLSVLMDSRNVSTYWCVRQIRKWNFALSSSTQIFF